MTQDSAPRPDFPEEAYGYLDQVAREYWHKPRKQTLDWPEWLGEDTRKPSLNKKDKAHRYKNKSSVQGTTGYGFKMKPGGALSTTQESSLDDHYAQSFTVDGQALFGTSEYSSEKKEFEINVVDAKVEVSVFSVFDEVWDNTPQSAVAQFAVPLPWAARLGDPTIHGTPLAPGVASPNVYIGGMPAWRVGIDLHMCPQQNPVPHGGGFTVSTGSTDVLINGFPAVRAGDFVVEPAVGPNTIIGGCPTVLIGSPAPPVPCIAPPPLKDDRIFRIKCHRQADLGYARGEFKAGSKNVAAVGKLEGVMSLGRGRYLGTLGVRIPFTDHVKTIKFDGALHVFTQGGEAGLDSETAFKKLKQQGKWGLFGFDAKVEFL